MRRDSRFCRLLKWQIAEEVERQHQRGSLEDGTTMAIVHVSKEISPHRDPITAMTFRACLHEGGGPQVGEVTRFNRWGNPPGHIISSISHFNLITFT